MKNIFLATLFCMAALFAGVQQTNGQTIRTIAGNGISDSSSGNGNCANRATMGQIIAVAVDSRNNVYLADNYYQVVRKVSPDGTITHFAGLGYGRYSGDGGPATAAGISAPYSLTTDRIGNVYIADAANLVIRKVDTAGIITTVAGTPGRFGYFNGDGIAATNAQIGAPGGVAVDNAGNIYIADANSRVRKVNTSGVISTVAGNGSVGYTGNGGPATNAALEGPIGVDVDSIGNVYICEKTNHVIRKVNTSGIISVFAGSTGGFAGDGGQATSAKLNSPNAIRHDKNGNFYIIDQGNQRIRKVAPSGVITTVVGNPVFTAGIGYVTDFYGDGRPATAAKMANPSDIGFDTYDNMYIADKGNGVAYTTGHRIREVFKVDTMHITVSPNDTICGTAHTVFSVHESVPHFCSEFRWFKNGIAVGTNTDAYVSDSTHDNDRISCTKIDTSNGGILLAVSDTLHMTVKPVLLPRAAITSSRDTLCAGESVTLNANPTNGGTSPTYEWYVFSALRGSGPTFSYVVGVGDIVTLVMHSNAVCAFPDTSHTQIRMNVNYSISSDITIIPHPNDTIAFWGQIISLFATTTLGGTSPTFQWFADDNPIPGATNDNYNAEIYSDVNLYCVMHSSEYCVVPAFDTSNTMRIRIGNLGVNNVNRELHQFTIGKNPNNGNFQLNGLLSPMVREAQVTITEMTGRTVYDNTIPVQNGNLSYKVDLGNDAHSGTYLLNIRYEGGNHVLKFVVCR